MLLSLVATLAYVTGFFCLNLAVAMLLPMAIDIYDGNPDWQAFFASAIFVGVLSLLVIVTTRGRRATFSLRFGFLLVNVLWVATTIVSALPFMLSGLHASLADAVFESVSGLTTTGSTVLSGLDSMPRGLLMWRSVTQWLGGIGIIAMGVLLFPFLQVGGMQFYRMESSVQSDKPVAKFAEFSRALVLIYVVITLANIVCYMFAGMDLFDAVNHAMTTISTGGYSTHDKSMAYFGRPVHVVAMVFMFIGAMPFVVFLRALVSKDIRKAYDPQITGLLVIFALFTLLLTGSAMLFSHVGAGEVALDALFNVISVVTTTGFVSADYSQWGPLAIAAIVVATFLGGAAGSTAGGVKTYRLIILFQSLRVALKELLYPHGVFVVRYDGRKVTDRAVRSITLFLAMYVVILLVMTMALAATGLDLETSLSGSLTALTNTGPGIGSVIGPVGNFATLSDPAKWVLSLGMLAGRLEIMTVLVLTTPAFWRT